MKATATSKKNRRKRAKTAKKLAENKCSKICLAVKLAKRRIPKANGRLMRLKNSMITIKIYRAEGVPEGKKCEKIELKECITLLK